MHVDARKALYERLHPETKKGGAPGAGQGKGKKRLEESQNEILVNSDHTDAFINDTAKKTGKSRATTSREAKRRWEG